MADYYLAPLFASVALMLPPGFERKPLTFYESLVQRRGGRHAASCRPVSASVLEYPDRSAGAVEAKEIEKRLRRQGRRDGAVAAGAAGPGASAATALRGRPCAQRRSRYVALNRARSTGRGRDRGG